MSFIDFKVGYFFGKQSTKYWLMCQEDIETMNKNLTKSKGSFMLWCDARDQQPEELPSKRQQIEGELEEIYQKHGNKYSKG